MPVNPDLQPEQPLDGGGGTQTPKDTNTREARRQLRESINQARANNTLLERNAERWNTVKTSMINWLKENVGQNVVNSLSNLEEMIIASSKANADETVDYLKDTKTHLLQLVSNPNLDVTVHGEPPREDAEDNVGNRQVPEIFGWNAPPEEQQQNGD